MIIVDRDDSPFGTSSSTVNIHIFKYSTPVQSHFFEEHAGDLKSAS